jgi:hypothetical protein
MYVLLEFLVNNATKVLTIFRRLLLLDMLWLIAVIKVLPMLSWAQL